MKNIPPQEAVRPNNQNRKAGFGYTVPNMIQPEAINCVCPPEDQLGGLYIGNFECAMNIQLLKKHRIRAVLTASIETGLKYAEEVVHFHEYFQAHDNDEYDITQHFEKSFQFIDRHRKYTSVLVHCFAGVSRSATLVVAYLMRKFAWNLQKALWFLKSKRRWVNPNPGFIQKLTSYETCLFGQLSKETHLFLLQNQHIFGTQNMPKQNPHNSSTPQLSRPVHQSNLQPSAPSPNLQGNTQPAVVAPPPPQTQPSQLPPPQNLSQLTPQSYQTQSTPTISLSPQEYQFYLSLPPNQQQGYLEQVQNNQLQAMYAVVQPNGSGEIYYEQQPSMQNNNSLASSQLINMSMMSLPQQQQQQKVYMGDQTNPLGINHNYLNMPQQVVNQQMPPNYYNPLQQQQQQYYIQE